MAGAPKDLNSLRRAGAWLVAICRACGRREHHDPAALARVLIQRGGNLAWSELPRQLPCAACGSADVRVSPGPSAKLGGHHQRLITLALKVLDDAAYRSATEAIDSPEVRLALRVLLPYVADRAGLLAYWERAQSGAPRPWQGCRHPYFMIAASLRERGWHAPV